jgi:archaellin
MSYGSLGLVAVALVITIMILGTATGSIILQTQDTDTANLNTIATEATNDLTSYLKVQQIIGRYDHTHSITQLAINIRLLVSGTIDLSHLTIELITRDNVLLLSYQANATSTLTSGALFSADSWQHLSPQSYAMLIMADNDNSILTGQTMNKNTDTGFLVVSLPETMALHSYDTLELRIIPNPGHIRQLSLDVPFDTHDIAVLYEEA